MTALVQLPVQLAHGPGPDIAKQTFKTVILIVGPWQKTLIFRVAVAGADLLQRKILLVSWWLVTGANLV